MTPPQYYRECTLMFSILFYFFFFFKCWLQLTELISWHIYGSWLSVWKTFYSMAWPLPSSLDFLCTTSCPFFWLSSVTPVSQLCLTYDMFTLALGPLHLHFCLDTVSLDSDLIAHFLFQLGFCSNVFLSETFSDCAHPCILHFLSYITFCCSHISYIIKR